MIVERLQEMKGERWNNSHGDVVVYDLGLQAGKLTLRLLSQL